MVHALSKLLQGDEGIKSTNTALHRQWVSLVTATERSVVDKPYETVQALGLAMRDKLGPLGVCTDTEVKPRPLMTVLLAAVIQGRSAMEGFLYDCPHNDVLDELLRVENPVIEKGLESLWQGLSTLNIHGPTKKRARDKFSNRLCTMSEAVVKRQKERGCKPRSRACQRECLVKAFLCMSNRSEPYCELLTDNDVEVHSPLCAGAFYQQAASRKLPWSQQR